jgi:acetyl-CoA synthetase
MTGISESESIESSLKETRVIKPSREVIERAWIKDYDEVYGKFSRDLEGSWTEIAKELEWFKYWDKVLEFDYPFARWFINARCNIVHNALDRHIKTWRKNKVAYFWEGENGERRVFTYYQLYCEVNKFANALKELGVKKGDRVSIYLSMIPELPIAMLAIAKIGAIHNVVFGGFSADALKDRIQDTESKILITADGAYYRGKVVLVKENADMAVKDCPTVQKVIVVRRVGREVEMGDRDVWWHDLVKEKSTKAEAEHMDSNDMLYILYTSGTTGKPKGVVHTHGGYMVGTYITQKWVFDMKDEDIYWCTADIGWVTGHSYVVYAPLMNGATSFMCEGAPDYPDPGRWWSIIERYGVTILYTAPTVVRMFMKYGEEWLERYDLRSLRLLGTVGEPINPEAWMWYYRYVGRGRCPIMDTWWQTETGQILITPMPCLPLKPGAASMPFPGIEADVVDKDGNPLPEGVGGYLVIKRPWPAMFSTIYKDPERYKQQYWELIPNVYATGDAATKDREGYFRILGRIDDILSVAGHRLGTMEIESALVSHPTVAEAAVIGKPHEIKGEVPVAFVVLKEGIAKSEGLEGELKKHVSKVLSPIAKPAEVKFVESLPKTRSGKIMRRLLKSKVRGGGPGDTSTLQD